mmetsp:Transcript_103262/g.333036  ORF Transcript_103262/g.333036 Transcript_103262/m.333036 type:complete len:230 (-) Transcript_103262:408-1097(-)
MSVGCTSTPRTKSSCASYAYRPTPCRRRSRLSGSGEPSSATASRYSRLKRQSIRLRFRCRPRGARMLSSSATSAPTSASAEGQRWKKRPSSRSTTMRPVLLSSRHATRSCQGSPVSTSSTRPKGLRGCAKLCCISEAPACEDDSGSGEGGADAAPGSGASRASFTSAVQASFADPRTAPDGSCSTTHQKGDSCVSASLAVQPCSEGRNGCERARQRSAWSCRAGSYSRK